MASIDVPVAETRMHPDRARRRDRSASPDRGDDNRPVDKPVTVGGKLFASKDDLIGYYRTILHAHEKGAVLGGEEEKMLSSLLDLHARAAAKRGVGIEHFMIVTHPEHVDTKCFGVKRTDGSTEDFSYLKIAAMLFPNARKTKGLKTKFLPGVILQVKGFPSSGPSVDKAQVESWFNDEVHIGRVEYIDAEDDPDKLFIRFDNPNTVSQVITKIFQLANEKKNATAAGLRVECLKGDAESAYWERVKVRVSTQSENRGRGRGRGGFRGRGGRGRGGFGGRGGRGRGGFRGGFDRDGDRRDFGGGSRDRGFDRGDDRGGYNKRPRNDY